MPLALALHVCQRVQLVPVPVTRGTGSRRIRRHQPDRDDQPRRRQAVAGNSDGAPWLGHAPRAILLHTRYTCARSEVASPAALQSRPRRPKLCVPRRCVSSSFASGNGAAAAAADRRRCNDTKQLLLRQRGSGRVAALSSLGVASSGAPRAGTATAQQRNAQRRVCSGCQSVPAPTSCCDATRPVHTWRRGPRQSSGGQHAVGAGCATACGVTCSACVVCLQQQQRHHGGANQPRSVTASPLAVAAAGVCCWRLLLACCFTDCCCCCCCTCCCCRL